MARFDPENYPDRLALQAHARRLRSGEIARLAGIACTRIAALLDYVRLPASTPINRDTRTGTPGR